MKKNFLTTLTAFFLTAISFTNVYSAATITLSSEAVAAANVNQGSTANVVYIAKIKVTTSDIIVNSVKFTLTGSADNTDLSNVYVYFNPSAPTYTGASYLGNAAAAFAAPHTYTINVYKPITAGSTGYFLITANVTATATDNHTFNINGNTYPLIFGFTTAANVTNNQNNAAGLQTIQGADITLTSSAVQAANLQQSSTGNVIYIAKMKVATEPVIVNKVSFTLTGSIDNTDLSNVYVYFNPSAPTYTGASYLGNASAAFAAPQTYAINIYKPMEKGASGYFLITANVTATATDDHTVNINGNTKPLIFDFTTDPNITNNQNNSAGLQTIQAADVTLTSENISAANLEQSSTGNVIYAAKMKVATEPAIVNQVRFTLTGSMDNTDLSNVYVYFNPSAPTYTGASYLGNASAAFAAPQTYSINVYKPMEKGASGYFLITANVTATATDDHTVNINGKSHPLEFGFTTAPNITSNQKNLAGVQTIQAADVTLTSENVNAGNIGQGSVGNVIYAAKMKLATEAAIVNNVTFTLTGSIDADDISNVYVYFNASAPVYSGASYLGSATANFAAPHTYSINVYKPMAKGVSGYFLITVNVSATATINHTVNIKGSTNPLVFGFTTAPNVTNNQNNSAGIKTIKSSGKAPVESVATQSSAISKTNNIEINNLYPNPASNIVSYTVIATERTKGIIQFADMGGKAFINSNVTLEKGINKLSINVTSMPNGVYQLLVKDEQGSSYGNKKVIIQH